MRLEPNEHGNYPCPYCGYILTAIFREWLPGITDYICHHCQIGFKIKTYGPIEIGGKEGCITQSI